jgi:microcin C transport system substrate-binding protein
MKRILPVMLMVLCFTVQPALAAPEVVSAHAMALHGEPKYKQGFTHFDYVNPKAPKGGAVTFSDLGTYDNFNRYAQRGVSAAGAGEIYDSLMVQSEDEIEVNYPLVAECIEYPTDFTWITFHLNPKARFWDGKPITAEDVVFTFNKFIKEGVPQFKQYYKDVTAVKAIKPLAARFDLAKGNKELLMSLGGLPVLPKHYWESRNFAEPTTEVPLGSAAYRVSDHKMGQYVTWQRVKDYWAKDLPTKKGLHNFDTIRYDYYRDETVALEAFKAGEYDIRSENTAKNWANLYTGPNFEKGYILKEEIPHEIPQGMQALVFNIQRPFFKDPRVREALGYAMDFEWLNKNLFYGQYKRTRSYFQNTIYEAKGLPGKEELKILEPLRDKIPPRVFTEEYQPPKTDGSGNIRMQLRKAKALLKEAGWEVKEKRMTDTKSGKALEFEILMYQQSLERIVIPIQKNLERMGVSMNIRLVDTTQFVNRMRNRDYDMISRGYSANPYPSSNLKIIWHSDYIDHTYNAAGVADPAIDALVTAIGEVQEDTEALLHHGRALDRVLQWNFFVMPEWHISSFRIARWDKFSRPRVRPKYAMGLDSWWFDSLKEKKLPQRRQKQ